VPRKIPAEHWKDEPDKHDYDAAEDYLSLLVPATDARKLARRLRAAPLVRRKAKDLLRASQLPVLAPENTHIVDDLKKVKAGEQLSPVLIVRGQLRGAVPLTIADGYHRICASYHLDEDADIPCRVVDMARA